MRGIDTPRASRAQTVVVLGGLLTFGRPGPAAAAVAVRPVMAGLAGSFTLAAPVPVASVFQPLSPILSASSPSIELNEGQPQSLAPTPTPAQTAPAAESAAAPQSADAAAPLESWTPGRSGVVGPQAEARSGGARHESGTFQRAQQIARDTGHRLLAELSGFTAMGAEAPTASPRHPEVVIGLRTLVGGLKHDANNAIAPLSLLVQMSRAGLSGTALQDMAQTKEAVDALGAHVKYDTDEALKRLGASSDSEDILPLLNGMEKKMTQLTAYVRSAVGLPPSLQDSRASKIYEDIMSATEMVDRVVNNYLGLIRLSSEERDPSLENVPARDVVVGIGEQANVLAKIHGISLTVDAPKKPIVVRTDAKMLEIILANLVGNALKYTRRGGVAVGVKTSDHPGYATFFVQDTGIGISPEDVERILAGGHHRTEAAQHMASGTGTGLHVIQKLLGVLHSGLILESAPGKGTLVSFELPLAAAEATP